MYREDREGKKGGGAILYVSSDIEQRSCKALDAKGYESSAWCWIIEKGGKKKLVGSIYRSPAAPKNDRTSKWNSWGEQTFATRGF